VFETTVTLFDSYGKLRTGLQRLDLEKSLPDETRDDNQNPGLARRPPRHGPTEWEEDDPVWKASRILEKLETFEAARKEGSGRTDGAVSTVGELKFGEIPSVPWLDSLTKQHCQNVLKEAANEENSTLLFPLRKSECVPACIIVELPTFEVPIVHEETHYPLPAQAASGPVTALDVAQYRKTVQQNRAANSSTEHMALVPFLDYESELDNPVEDKYRTLAHDLLRGLVDPALKPDREQRNRLAAIIASPSHHPTREEKGLSSPLTCFCFELLFAYSFDG
jgi:hypothetical protein